MRSSEQIMQSFFESYAADGRGENFKVDKFTGVTLGVVVDTDDPLQMGRIRVFCPALNDSPKKVQHIPWASYASPYGGSINNSGFLRGVGDGEASTEGATHYGFWGIPEFGSNVLVTCIDGDNRRRVWLGSMPQHQEVHTMFSGRWKWDQGNVDGPLSSSGRPIQPLYDNLRKAFSDDIGSAEWKTRAADYQIAAIRDDLSQVPNGKKTTYLDQTNESIINNENDEWVKEFLGSHGYDWSGFKNLGAYLSSRVFGFSTPGFHSFSMDDRPFNSRIKIRTATGHTMIFDDTNERIYLATNSGESYIEMDSNGNIDVYSGKRLSFSAEDDINFTTKGTFRVTSEKGIHMYAGSLMGDQISLEDYPADGQIRIHAQEDIHLKTEQSLRTLVGVDMLTEVLGDQSNLVSGSLYNEIGVDINNIAKTGDISSEAGRDMNEIIGRNSKRYSGGQSSIGATLSMEVLSFNSTLSLGSKDGTNVKSATGDVSFESLGVADGTGQVRFTTPTSQFSVGQDGITALTPGNVNIKSGATIQMETTPSIPTVSDPVSLEGLPDIPTPSDIPVEDIPWDSTRTTITDLEAVKVAYNAGFRDRDLITAVAVMIGESSLNTKARNLTVNDEIWGDVVGLFQIRTLKNPENYSGVDRLRDNRNGQLENPNINASVAYEIFTKLNPRNQWTVGKWDILRYEDRMSNILLPRAVAAVNEFYGLGPVAMPMSSIKYGIGSSTILRIDQNRIALNSTGSLDFYSASNANTFDSISNTIDSLSTNLNMLTYTTSIFYTAAQSAISSVGGSLSIPISFDVGCLLSNLYNALPQELLDVAGSLAELNALIVDLGYSAVSLNNLVSTLQSNPGLRTALGISDITFDINFNTTSCNLPLPVLTDPVDSIPLSVFKVEQFNPMIDGIYRNFAQLGLA